MKEKLLNCDICKELTRHLTFSRYSQKGRRVGYRQRRQVRHCTQCNIRTIYNGKQNITYQKDLNEKNG